MLSIARIENTGKTIIIYFLKDDVEYQVLFDEDYFKDEVDE